MGAWCFASGLKPWGSMRTYRCVVPSQAAVKLTTSVPNRPSPRKVGTGANTVTRVHKDTMLLTAVPSLT